MPRPKGSKNKPKVVSAPANLDEQIKAVTVEIAEQSDALDYAAGHMSCSLANSGNRL